MIEQLHHLKRVADGEVQRLKGQLKSVETQHKLLTQQTDKNVDKDAPPPWKPNSGTVGIESVGVGGVGGVGQTSFS